MIDYRLESESTDKIIPALIAARMACKGIETEAVNPQFKSKYAKLDGVINEINPHLNAQALYLDFSTFQDQDGQVIQRTRIEHVSGQYKQSFFPIKPDPEHRSLQQAFGKAQTYQQRRQLLGLFGICPQNEVEDNDGNITAATPGQLKFIKDLLAVTKIENAEQKILDRLNIKSIDQVPFDACDGVINWLKGK